MINQYIKKELAKLINEFLSKLDGLPYDIAFSGVAATVTMFMETGYQGCLEQIGDKAICDIYLEATRITILQLVNQTAQKLRGVAAQ